MDLYTHVSFRWAMDDGEAVEGQLVERAEAIAL